MKSAGRPHFVGLTNMMGNILVSMFDYLVGC